MLHNPGRLTFNVTYFAGTACGEIAATKADDALMPASDYRRHELLGEGTFGKVYKGEVVATGRAVAIKKLLKVSSRKEGVELATLREIMLLQELVHENVIELVEVLCAHGGISLVFEYCVTDLEAIVKDRDVLLDAARIKGYMLGTLRGDLAGDRCWCPRRVAHEIQLVAGRPQHRHDHAKVAALFGVRGSRDLGGMEGVEQDRIEHG